MERITDDLAPPPQPNNNESFHRPEQNKCNNAPPLPPSLVEDEKAKAKFELSQAGGAEQGRKFNPTVGSKTVKSEGRLDKFRNDASTSQATHLKDVVQHGSNRYSSREGVEQCSDIDSGPMSTSTLDGGDQKRLNKLTSHHPSVSSKGSQRLTDEELSSSNQTSLEHCADGDSGPADLSLNSSKQSLSTLMQSRSSLERCTDGDAGPSSAHTDPAAEKMNHSSIAFRSFAGSSMNSFLSEGSIGQEMGVDSVGSTNGGDDGRGGNDVSIEAARGASEDIEAGQMQTAEITAEVQVTSSGDGVAPLEAFLVGEGPRGDDLILGVGAKPVLPWYKTRRIQVLIFFALLVVSGAIGAGVIFATQKEETITQVEIIQGDPQVITNITYVQNDTVIVQTEIINRVIIASLAPSVSLYPTASPISSNPTRSIPDDELTRPMNTEGPSGLFQVGDGGLSAQPEEQIDATPTFAYIGEGACVDEYSNVYDSIRYSPVSSASKCEKKCVSLDTDSVALVGFGYWNWSSLRQCFCFIRDGLVASDSPGNIEDKCPPDADVCVSTASGSGGVVASSNKSGVEQKCYRNPNFTSQPTTPRPTTSQPSPSPTNLPITAAPVNVEGFALVGLGSCQDSDAGLYDSIQFSATSTLSCQDLCVEFIDGLVGYHYASVGRCYCNLDNGYLTGNTGFGNCPPGAQCLSGNDGSGPVEFSSGRDTIVCYKNNNFA